MKANAFTTAVLAGSLALAAGEAASQTQQPQAAAPVHVTVPPGGLTFNFTDIDKNGDKQISVEEWNAFVASVQSRAAAKQPGSAAAGATGAAKPPSQSQK